MRNYTLTPVQSTTVFGQTDAQFECEHCWHSELFTAARYFDQYHIRGWDHIRSACPVARLI